MRDRASGPNSWRIGGTEHGRARFAMLSSRTSGCSRTRIVQIVCDLPVGWHLPAV